MAQKLSKQIVFPNGIPSPLQGLWVNGELFGFVAGIADG